MKKVTVNIISVLLIILFVHAALIKGLDYGVFKNQLSAYPLLSPFAGLIAWMLPAAELLTACLLISPRSRMIGLSVSLSLMVLLSGYIIFLLQTADKAPCACQGLLGLATWPAQLKFNLVFLLIALLGFLLQLLAIQEERLLRFTTRKA